MTQSEILDETQKCIASPYYFATTYLKVVNHLGKSVPFTTSLSEADFNELAYRNAKRNIRLKGRR
jgi:hypothetical protein